MLTEEKEFRTQLIRKIVGSLATKDNQELVEVLADVGDPEKGYSRRALSELPAVQKALKEISTAADELIPYVERRWEEREERIKYNQTLWTKEMEEH